MNIINHKGGLLVNPKNPTCLWAYCKHVVFKESDLGESTQIFNYNLPDGLSLRSVRVVNGVSELRFTASPKVPTLQDEDFAVCFRLAAENKRPVFGYVNFPPNHPFHSSRWLNHYSPKWLQGTSLGKLLADVDWNMKCLYIGARSNEDKTTFKSWPKSSNLKGLATHLAFPRKENMLWGSIKMYCDHAKVKKTKDEIFFPEEPKMKIVDQFSDSYSAYITDRLPSVAYHDEPKFLKMQEMIKLILAVEWLYNEKKVRVNQSWVQFHTENISEEQYVTLIESFPEREEAPPEMVPTPPPEFEPPSTDATICTANSEVYNALIKNFRYGYINFGGCEARIFTDEGENYLFQNCLKSSLIMHTPACTIKCYDNIALDDEDFKNMKIEDGDDETTSTSKASTLLLPKISSRVQVPVGPGIDAIISVTLFKTDINSQNDRSSIHDNKDIFMDILKAAEENSIFGPLEELVQNLEDSSADNTPENRELVIKSMKTCLESALKTSIEESLAVPATVCASIDEFSFDDGVKLSLNISIIRHAPSTLPPFEITGTMKLASNDLDFVFSHCNPNTLFLPIIPGLYQEIIPGVSSWEELLSEMSTPIPRFWQDPYTGMGIPSDQGGVSTTDIPVLPVLAGCAATLAVPFTRLKNSSPKFEPPRDSESKVEPPKFEPPSDSTYSSETENVQNDESSTPANRPAFPHNNEKKDKKKHRVKQRQIEATDMDELVVRSSHIKGI